MNKKQKAQSKRKPMRCPYCGSAMTLRSASYVYSDCHDDRQMYVCNRFPSCNTYVGTHPGTKEPLGIVMPSSSLGTISKRFAALPSTAASVS